MAFLFCPLNYYFPANLNLNSLLLPLHKVLYFFFQSEKQIGIVDHEFVDSHLRINLISEPFKVPSDG